MIPLWTGGAGWGFRVVCARKKANEARLPGKLSDKA